MTDEEWDKIENENVDSDDTHVLISWGSIQSAIGVKISESAI